ncbi:MAG: hypothetical protein QXS93_02850 [Candidatus Micrarchaeia archaeon]
MKIVDYDAETYAILVKKHHLENAGFQRGEDVYIITLEKGMLAVIRKSSFREHLKEKVRSSLGLSKMPPVELNADDIALLKKITSVKFEERIPENVLRMLSEDEMETLKSLVDRGVLSVYKGGKYQAKGVYTISKDIYKFVRQLIQDKEQQEKEEKIGGEYVQKDAEDGKVSAPAAKASHVLRNQPAQKPSLSAVSASEPQVPDYKQVGDAIKALEKEGILVIANDELARSISMTLQEKIKKGAVMGMKGFDGKYYIMTSKKYAEAESLIRTYLMENRRATLSELSKSLGLAESVCKGVLNFLLENGDVIEKSRGKYELVA